MKLKTTLLCVCLVLAGQVPADQSLQVALGDASAPASSVKQPLWQVLDDRGLRLKSKAALVVDGFGNELYARNVDQPLPIASITKLMTAMVVLDSGLPLDEEITIAKEDRDLVQFTGSRLSFGARLSRLELVRLALMASENRAAAALGRTYPGGTEAFVRAMNAKAWAVGMYDTEFADPAGLDPANMATARDLAKLVRAAARYPEIQAATTQTSELIRPWPKRGPLRYVNTNRLIRNRHWDIELSKTGYLNEAGRCLVMQAEIAGEPLVIVLLNSFGKLTPYGDSNRIRKWIEKGVASS